MRRLAIVFLLAIVPFTRAAVAAAPQPDPVLAAMQDEMQRSMTSLRIEGQPAPYYIAYQLDDTSGRRLTARLGEIGDEDAGRSRVLRVEVRVGDYDFDSSRFTASGVAGDTLVQVLDDDYDVIRRHLWLLTDAAYKRAVNVFARKKAAFQNRRSEETLPDFSKATPQQRELGATPPAAAWNDWSERARQMSAVFLADPAIQASEVNVIEERGRRHYVNSEGFSVVMPIGLSGVRVVAESQAEDGATVRDFFELFERSLTDMPPAPELLARTRALAARMAEARAAPAGEEYSGPVLFEGRAGAELVAQVLVPALLATRAPDTERGAATAVPPFLSRIGARVAAEGISVLDTPSLSRFGALPVAGAYEMDDEGVAAKDVALIEDGRLLTLLTNRIPQRGLPESNGHGRGGGVQAGVVQVTSSAAVPAAALKGSYIALLKEQGRPFGYIVRSIASPASLAGSTTDPAEIIALLTTTLQGGAQAGPAGPVIPQIIRVHADGREERVRAMRFGALAPTMFRDVLGASEERELLTYRGTTSVGGSALGGRQVPVSVIAPGFIVDDLEINRLRESAQTPPVVASPLVR